MSRFEREKKQKKTIPRMQDFLEKRPIIGYVVLTFVLMFLVFAADQGASFLKASILNIEKFDGAALPIRQVPDWTKTGGKNDRLYSDYSAAELVPLPKYDGKELERRCATNDVSYRNACITFSTVYMGTYHMDHIENGGSHLAVDIRVPKGTPVYAVANGIVETAVSQNSGFGQYIVIRHPDAPLPGGGKENLYSGYAHLSSLAKKKGDFVSKGDLIGHSGDSGISTTPHLHFQIDRDKAPWHPWWPFSNAEASAAGVSFFEGINTGLGKEAALEKTINPMPWVQQHLNYTGDNKVNANEIPTPTKTPKPTKTPEIIEITETPIATPIPTPAVNVPSTIEGARAPVGVAVSVDKSSLFPGDSVRISVMALDAGGQVLTNPRFDGEMEVILEGEGIIEPIMIKDRYFKDGTAAISYTAGKDPGSARVFLKNFPNDAVKIDVVTQMEPVSGFEVGTDGRFTKNKSETIMIKTLDSNGRPTQTSFIGKAYLTLIEGTGKFNRSELISADFKNGIATVTFTPTADGDVRIKIKSGVLVGESKPLTQGDETGSLFSDIPDDYPYKNAIETLKAKAILGGNPDGTFRPENGINRAEFAKVILLALGINPRDPQGGKFTDVSRESWYAPFAETAALRSIVKGYPDGSFGPGRNINRAELFAILARAENKPVTRDSGFTDVPKDAWYAEGAGFAKQYKLLDFGNRFYPDKVMSRGEVAEAVARFIEM